METIKSVIVRSKERLEEARAKPWFRRPPQLLMAALHMGWRFHCHYISIISFAHLLLVALEESEEVFFLK